MQLTAFLLVLLVSIATVFSIPVHEATRSRRETSPQLSEKRQQQKARSGYIRFGKRRVDPNAELLYLDQLLL